MSHSEKDRLEEFADRWNGIEMRKGAKQQIYYSLRESIEIRERKRSRNTLLNKVSIALILFLLFGGAMYVMNLTGGEKRELGYGGEQLSSFYSLKELPEDFEIVELSDGSWDFISAGQLVVGGLRLMNEETMIEKTSNPILFEKLYPQDFPYPAVKTLEHIKSQGIAQIIHYYILHDKDHVYHLYFYTPFFSKERAEEVARSFQID